MSIGKQIGAFAKSQKSKSALKALALLGVGAGASVGSYHAGKRKGSATAIQEALPIMQQMNSKENSEIAQHFYKKGIRDQLMAMSTFSNGASKTAAAKALKELEKELA
jgi:hypothetical protein